MENKMINAAERLFESGAPAHAALECGDERIAYAELRERVRRAAGAWQVLGLAAGDKVIVFSADSIDWVVTYLGVIWGGGVAIGVNPRLPLAELEAVATESEVRFIWCAAEHAEELSTAVKAWPRALAVVASGGGGKYADWDGSLVSAKGVDALARKPQDAALWIGTSGTTGKSKGVIHTQQVTGPCAAFAREVLGATADDRLYATSKLFFAYALTNSLFAGMRLGATVILDPEWPTPQRVVEMVERYRPSILFGVPTLYNKMIQEGLAERLAGSSLRYCISAGEALPPTVMRGWRAATGLGIISGYGTSETMCLMLYSDDESGLAKPTPLTEVKYADGADPREPQRIWLRHPAVAAGYYQRPEAEADGFSEGWYSPGDTFIRHAGGRLEFAGRNDDMLKISGQWVSTLWIEQALVQACGGAVLQLASIGVPTADGLTALAVLAVPAPGREGEAAERMDAGLRALPKYRQPLWLHWVDELPLTATGKLQRSQLHALHEGALRKDAAGKILR